MKKNRVVKLCLSGCVLGFSLTSFLSGQEADLEIQIAAKKTIVAEKARVEASSETKKNLASLVESLVAEKPVAKKPQTNPYVRPDGRTRFKRYVKSTVGPFSLLGNAASAGITTATNEPEEWGKDGEGFARRFASNVGESVIQGTVIYGLDETLKLDSHFYKSKKRDVGSRFKNAMLSTVTARNTRGKRVLGVPRIVGTYSSRVIARETWYPKRYNYKDGLKSGSISLGFNAAFNLFREFILK